MKKFALLFAGLVLVLLAMAIFPGSTNMVDAQDGADCGACHNDTTVITGKVTAWEESGHGTGGAYGRGTRSSCAGCHSGGAFSAMVEAGLNFSEVEAGDPNPTRQECRTCHNIHTTYTGDDWSLETTDPVDLAIFEGVTFDGGEGNLCANCHQPRRMFEAEDGIANVSSTHWGPHYGMQASMLLGINGDVEGSASPHMMVSDTCVGCHMSNDNHSFEPSVSVCQGCHGEEVENFDINGTLTHIEELFHELEELLIAEGMLECDEDHHCAPVPGEYPEAQAAALWNYRAIYQDHSHGAHNPAYVTALLESGIAAFSE